MYQASIHLSWFEEGKCRSGICPQDLFQRASKGNASSLPKDEVSDPLLHVEDSDD